MILLGSTSWAEGRTDIVNVTRLGEDALELGNEGNATGAAVGVLVRGIGGIGGAGDAFALRPRFFIVRQALMVRL